MISASVAERELTTSEKGSFSDVTSSLRPAVGRFSLDSVRRQCLKIPQSPSCFERKETRILRNDGPFIFTFGKKVDWIEIFKAAGCVSGGRLLVE